MSIWRDAGFASVAALLAVLVLFMPATAPFFAWWFPAIDPPVFRLRWLPNQPTKWVQGARNFDEFASILGLKAV